MKWWPADQECSLLGVLKLQNIGITANAMVANMRHIISLPSVVPTAWKFDL